MATYDELIERGEEIRDETRTEANSATRIGQYLLDVLALVGTGGATFPADEPNTATTIGNLPAGSPLASRPILDVFRQAASQVYQAPGFNSFNLQGQGSRNEEVGTPVPSGFKSFTWSTSNSQNVQATSVKITDVNNGAVLAQNEANDGSASASTSSFTVALGESRRYRIEAKNSNNQAFSTDLTISGYYRAFYDSVANTPADSASVRALANSFLIGGGGQLTLNTGTSNRRFAVWLPQGHSITGVIDQDALNADLTSQYVGSALSVNDAGGTPRAGTLYVMTQAVPYSSSHRHLISYN